MAWVTFARSDRKEKETTKTVVVLMKTVSISSYIWRFGLQVIKLFGKETVGGSLSVGVGLEVSKIYAISSYLYPALPLSFFLPPLLTFLFFSLPLYFFCCCLKMQSLSYCSRTCLPLPCSWPWWTLKPWNCEPKSLFPFMSCLGYCISWWRSTLKISINSI